MTPDLRDTLARLTRLAEKVRCQTCGQRPHDPNECVDGRPYHDLLSEPDRADLLALLGELTRLQTELDEARTEVYKLRGDVERHITRFDQLDAGYKAILEGERQRLTEARATIERLTRERDEARGRMTGRFEWHITVPGASRSEAMKLAEQTGWVFSEITGCPILGQGTYCYITGYHTEFNSALGTVRAIAESLRAREVKVLREKIENIVYDTKTGMGHPVATDVIQSTP
jgi:hypothetical protein